MHTKAALARISRTRLILALLSALTLLKISNPKAYNQVEAKLFKEKHVRATKKRSRKSRKSKRKRSGRKNRSGKRPTAKQIAARRAFVRKFAGKKGK